MRSKPHYQPGDHIFGHYLVHQVLQGGMGEVYLCLYLEAGLPFALKTLQARYVTDLRLRAAFEHEVATWVALERHPNIVRCHYLQVLDNLPFLVMEWVEGDEVHGVDLRGWLRRGRLNVRQTLLFGMDICRGLAHASRKQPGIVHCDLKPENVLVSQEHIAKITDFGLARVAQQAQFATEVALDERSRRQGMQVVQGVAGTPPYMAPEQWRGDGLDVRTDIYAVGCILYEALSGRMPFPGPTLADFRRQHLNASVPRLPVAELPAALNDVIQRCLAKAPSDRLTTADDLLGALERVYAQHVGETPPVRTVGAEYSDLDYSNRGATYLRLKRYDQALADFDRAIALSPDTARYYANRAVVQLELHQTAQAFADLDRAIALDPTAPITYNQLGNTHSAVGQHEQALAAFTQAIALEPAYANAYYNRGNSYVRLKQWESALADYSRVLQLDPTHTKAYTDRGLLLHNRGNDTAALADFERAIQLDPVYALAFSNRGQTYVALGQFDAALRDFMEALRLDPGNADAYDGRGLAYKGLQRYAEALADSTRAIELNPTETQPRFNRGLLYQRLQDYEQAAADFSAVIQLDPADAQAYNMRGNAYRDLGRYAEALADFGKALELDPNYPKPYYNRGLVFDQQKNYPAAFADFRRTTELEPSFAPAHFNLGVMCANAGEWRAALLAFERAQALGMAQAAAYIERARAALAEAEAKV